MLIPSFILGIFLAALSVDLTVAQTDQAPRLDIKPSGNQTRSIGENVFVSCLVTPDTAKSFIENVRWKDPNGMEIGAGQGNRIYTKSASNTYGRSLFIQKAQEQDGGLYTCEAEHPGHNKMIAHFYLILFRDITFEGFEAKQTPIAGAEGKITCSVSGNPAPSVSWMRGKDEIKSEGRYRIESDGLVISDINEADDGEYLCMAMVEEMGRTDQRLITVEVQRKPQFDEGGQPSASRGLEGRSVSMECKVTGRPTPTIRWVFTSLTFQNNNQEDVTLLEHDEQKAKRHTVDPVTGTMTINDLKKIDQGDYKCMAENTAGQLEAAAALFVAEKPRFDILTNVTVNEGDSATIDCTVRGDPSPLLTYTHEEDPVPLRKDGDSRIVLSESDKKLSLTINNVNRNDDGLYWCEASNEAATEKKASHITVQFAPSFVRTPMHTAKTWMGNPEAVNLTCIAESIPNATIRWEKRLIGNPTGLQSMPITRGQQGYAIEDRPASSSLLVTADNVDIFGEFMCIASNELGENRHTITLHQASVPAPVTVQIAEKTANTLRFDIFSPDEPNNLALDNYEVAFIELPGGTWMEAKQRSWPVGVAYTVDGLEPGHRYGFRFYAVNRLGRSLDSRIYEETMPDIGPPRPPGLVAMNATSDEASRYRLLWLEPADNGARLMDYHITYWKAGEGKQGAKSVIVKAPAGHHMLTSLDGGSLYNVEITARNEKGFSAPLQLNFTTGYGLARGPVPLTGYHRADPIEDETQLSVPVIIGIAIAAALILALLIDLTCFFTRRAGVIAWIAGKAGGKSEKLRNHDTENIPHIDAEITREEKEPLTAPPRITTTHVKTTTTFKEEKEPEDKASPQDGILDKSAALLVRSGSPPYSGGSPRKYSLSGSSFPYPSSINPSSSLYDPFSSPYCQDFENYGSYNVGVTRSNSVGSLHQMETDV